MSQGTKIVAVVLFVLFVGTGVYYLTLSPASPPGSPAGKVAGNAAEPAAKPSSARDPGSITMNPPAPRIADPLAPGASSGAAPAASATSPAAVGAVSGSTPSASASGTGATPPRITLGPGGAPASVMPPLAFSRPAAPPAATAPGVPPVRPTAAVPAVTPAPVVAADATPPTSPTSATAGPREHVVASGETLSSIAARFLGSESRWAEIAKANPGVNPNSMRVGTKLAIPSVASASPSSGTRTASAPAASAGEYVVKAGDTLTGIARQTMGSADWESIYEANRSVIGTNPAALRVGMRLSIPKRS